MPTPRLKSIFLTLPLPFTVVALSVGLPMDAANVLSMALLFGYIHTLRWLHDRLHVPIVAAIGLGLVVMVGSLTPSLMRRIVSWEKAEPFTTAPQPRDTATN